MTDDTAVRLRDQVAPVVSARERDDLLGESLVGELVRLRVGWTFFFFFFFFFVSTRQNRRHPPRRTKRIVIGSCPHASASESITDQEAQMTKHVHLESASDARASR